MIHEGGKRKYVYLTASLSMRSASLLSKYPLCDASIVRQGLPRLKLSFTFICKLHLLPPEGPGGGGHRPVHIGLVALLDLGDDLACGGIQGREGLPGHAIVELVVNKNASVLKNKK